MNIKKMLFASAYTLLSSSFLMGAGWAWFNDTRFNPMAHMEHLHPNLTPLKVMLDRNKTVVPGSIVLQSLTLGSPDTKQFENQEYEIENLNIGLSGGMNELNNIIPGSLALESIIEKTGKLQKLKIVPVEKNLFLPTGVLSYTTGDSPSILFDFIPESSIGEGKSQSLNLYALIKLICKKFNISTLEAFRGLALIDQHAIEVKLNLLLTEKEFTLDSIDIVTFRLKSSTPPAKTPKQDGFFIIEEKQYGDEIATQSRIPLAELLKTKVLTSVRQHTDIVPQSPEMSSGESQKTTPDVSL